MPSFTVTVDLDAIRHNVLEMRRRAPSAEVMAVVKANAYGHGLAPVAAAARQAGATWVGLAQLEEALAARHAGVQGRILTWLYPPGSDLEAALMADLDISVGSLWSLREVEMAARARGTQARVHLKVDSGLGRGGALRSGWSEVVAAAAPLAAEGVIEVVSVWSHFASSDEPHHPSVRAQQECFDAAVEEAARYGIRPQLRHLSNSAAALTNPGAHYDVVRAGLAMYGLSPLPNVGQPHEFGLREAMRVTAQLAAVKRAPAGMGISYGHTYRTSGDTVLGLVPMGYADGLMRTGSNAAPVSVGGRRHTVAGRVCMDQFVVDLGPDFDGSPGDEVVVLGSAARGEVTAQDWASACGTISYEIVTCLAPRAPRHYVGEQP